MKKNFKDFFLKILRLDLMFFSRLLYFLMNRTKQGFYVC